MKTFSARPQDIRREWYIVDAHDKVLGHLATKIAHRLRGKHKPEYTPHMDLGDYVVVTNAGTIRVTGNKNRDKIYYRHTGYPGGIRKRTFKEYQEKFPGRVLKMAVKGMLPKGPLGYAMLKKLRVYPGGEHQHAAQKPQTWEI